MAGYPLYLLGMALAAASALLWPRLRLRTLFVLWGTGLLLMRVAPPLLGLFAAAAGASVRAFVFVATGWAGSILVLRSLLGLTLWERPFRRRTWIAALGATLALALSYHADGRLPGAILAVVPWLWSMRWSRDMSGLRLSGVSVGAFVSLLLFTISFGSGVDPTAASRMPGLVGFQVSMSFSALLYALLAVVRLSWRVQFSIRRISWRLVASHLLAGLIPGILAISFLLLASTLYLSTYRGTVAGRALWKESQSAERRMTRAFRNGEVPEEPFGTTVPGQVLITRVEGEAASVAGGHLACNPDSLLATSFRPREALLLWDGSRLFLRARFDTTITGRRTVVEALAPVDSLWMAGISEIVGAPARVDPFVRVTRTETGISVGESDDGGEGTAIGPRKPQGLQLPGGTIVPCLFATPGGWKSQVIPVVSYASPGELVTSLVSKSEENPLATVVLIILAILALLLLVAIWMTTGMVIGMGRSIAKTVRALTDATRALREGKLEHRIVLEGQDELWNVAASFNEMAEGLERMRAVELERERMEQELRLARDIQKRLLPPGPPVVEGLDLAGTSLPARHVGGDYFDYLPLEDGAVGIVVADVSGKGVPAALLMSSFRASVRSEDLGALGPGRVLSRVNRFVCASVDPGKFITAFVGVLDPRTGLLRYASAGHDPPVTLEGNGVRGDLPEGGLLLGVLPEAQYAEASVQLAPGTVLAVYTDGVTEAQSPSEEFFGRERLVAALGGASGISCARLLERVVAEIERFAATAPQYDDITLVLARRT